jgi:hypothetical protein
MTTINAVGNSLSSQTGSGSFVGSTGASLTTPNIGVATATSIQFGSGSILSTYANAQSFTPTFTFATPGNLSVAYGLQIGTYYQIGNIVLFAITLQFTPTYTTSSGNALIASLPVAASASNNWVFNNMNIKTVTYPAGCTQLFGMSQGGTTFFLAGQGSATAATDLTTTQIVSGVQYYFDITGIYGA